jgi:hypothetical protein
MREEEQPPVLPLAFVKKFEQKLGIEKDSPKFKETKKGLVTAGYLSDRALAVYLGIRLGLALAHRGSPWVLHKPWVRPCGGAFYLLIVASYFLPRLILARLIAARQTRIRRVCPTPWT